MGWFGGPKQQKCPRCGANMPFVISGGDRSDDLMRRSKLNVGQSGGLCSNCMRAAHQAAHVPNVLPPPPLSQSTETDPQFEQSLETAKRVAAVFGNKIEQADVEKVKARLRQSGGDNPLGESLAYQFKNTMRGCLWTLLLAITAFVVFGWLVSEDKSTDPPTPVATSAPPIAGGGPVPLGSPGAWLTTADYPESAIRAKVEGVTGFRLEVSHKGAVTACIIVDSSGNDELDNAACNAIIRRARFTPARDENGNAASSSYSNKVRWILPKD